MTTPLKILIADDSESMLSSIGEMLLTEGKDKFSIYYAHDGMEATVLAFQEFPDLIIIDLEMPVMSGLDAIRQIKKHDVLKATPIIVMSATRRFNAAIEAGANDFILKPFSAYELHLRVTMNINLALNDIEVKRQHDMLKIQKQEVTLQRDTIKKQQRELLDDLTYASYIQKAILPDNAVFEEISSNFFIFNKPKNIVSGDFYWVSKKNGLVIFAVGDCTGHGLSGALMTMAGAAHMNEIVSNFDQTEPDVILNNLRTRVIKLLHQKGNIGEASNGMDLAICVYNPETSILQYAGANNPAYIIKADNTLEILKADRMPIGIHINHQKPFTSKTIKMSKGDNLYLFTDGFADQFGGISGQKFRYNQFQQLLKSISVNPMAEQLKIIQSTIKEWMDNFEQVDDMLILGLKF